MADECYGIVVPPVAAETIAAAGIGPLTPIKTDYARMASVGKLSRSDLRHNHIYKGVDRSDPAAQTIYRRN
jgi:hypothetical protein